MRIVNHDNIIKLFSVYESEKFIHLVQEYLSGGELYMSVNGLKTYSEKNVADIMHGFISALDYLHDRKITHWDLKPENLILSEEDVKNVKIADFGLATLC